MATPFIYVIEDDPVYRRFLERQLEISGFSKFKSFPNGTSALETVKADKPGFILLDFGLDGLNGLDLLKNFKKINKKIKVFIITGLEDTDLERRCVEAGADMFVRKSQVMGTLPAEMVEMMNKKKGWFSFG